MNLLFVGDPHVKQQDLEDCENLLKFVEKVSKEDEVDGVVFLGDLFHNHAVVHVSVLNFWDRWLRRLAKVKPVIALKGNHDFGLGNPDQHSLIGFTNIPDVTIVDKWKEIGNYVFMGYLGHNKAETMYEYSRQSGKKQVLVCHDTFNGAKYENGFYAPDGLDLEKIVQPVVISGHIHTPQKVGKCHYIGSPRWQTISDANTIRYISLFNDKGEELKKYPTVGVCKSIWVKNIESEDDIKPFDFKNSETRYEVRGKDEEVKQWIKKIAKVDKNAIIRTHIDNDSKAKVKESIGLAAAYVEYAKVFAENKGLGPDFMKLVEERSKWTI